MCASRFAIALALALASPSLARAQSPADMGPPPPADLAPLDDAAPSVAAKSQHAGSPIATALDDFDFGNYEGVVQGLRLLVETGGRDLPNKADRMEALRVYGIACTLTGRRVAAEGAFLLLLREEPSMHLDPALVRPEAVAFFEEVRARHRDELVAAYRQGRPRYYMGLNILPLVGQIQNRQWKKLAIIGALDFAFLATSLTTGSLLQEWQQPDHTFKGHQDAYKPLLVIDAVGFASLLGVTLYGIADGFVVGARRQRAERERESALGF